VQAARIIPRVRACRVATSRAAAALVCCAAPPWSSASRLSRSSLLMVVVSWASSPLKLRRSVSTFSVACSAAAARASASCTALPIRARSCIMPSTWKQIAPVRFEELDVI
jgi:hypothetical protein